LRIIVDHERNDPEPSNQKVDDNAGVVEAFGECQFVSQDFMTWLSASEESPIHVIIPNHNIDGRNNSACQENAKIVWMT